jgi:hypothetical protein
LAPLKRRGGFTILLLFPEATAEGGEQWNSGAGEQLKKEFEQKAATSKINYPKRKEFTPRIKRKLRQVI